MARLEIDLHGRDKGLLTLLKNAEKAIDNLQKKAKSLQVNKIDIDVQQAITGVNSLNKLLAETSKEIKNVNAKKISVISGDAASGIGNTNSSLKGLIGTVTGLAAAYISLESAISGMKAAFNIAIKTDAIEASFGFVFKDSAKRIEELRREANRLGVDYIVLAEANKKFLAAAQASSFSMTEAEKIFSSVANAGAKLKLSNEQVGGTFLAIEQMISKGTVSMEELRRQLGDRLPGAFAMAARAMGMTEARFNKAVANGEVMARELLPKLASELDKTYGNDKYQQIDSLQASTNRLSNTMTELVSTSGAATMVFKPFIDTLDSLVRTIFVLDNTTRSAVDRFKDSEGAFIANEKELRNLIARQEELKGKTNLNASEQNELKNIVNQVSNILPKAVIEWDKYGNAISYSTERVYELLSANRNLIADMKKNALSDLNKDAEKYSNLLRNISKRLQEMSDKGVSFLSAGPYKTLTQEDLQKDAKDLKEKLANTYLDIRDLTGKLKKSQVDFLESNGYQFYINRAKADVKTIEQAIDAIKRSMNASDLDRVRLDFSEFDGSKKFEDAIKKRLAELNKLSKSLDEVTKDLERKAKAAEDAFSKIKEIGVSAEVTISDDPLSGINEKYRKQFEELAEEFDKAIKNGMDPNKVWEEYFKSLQLVGDAKAKEIGKKTAETLTEWTEKHVKSLEKLEIQMERKPNQDVVQQLTKRLNEEYKLKVAAYNNEKNLAKKTQEEINADQLSMQTEYWKAFSSIEIIDNLKNIGIGSLKKAFADAEKEFNDFISTIDDPKVKDMLRQLFGEFKENIRLDLSIKTVRDLENIQREIQSIVSSFTEFDNSLGGALLAVSNIVSALGSLGKSLVNIGGDVATSLGKAFSSPGLGIAGAVLGIAGSIFSAISESRKREKEEIRKQNEELKAYYDGIIKGELDYQSLLRQRRYNESFGDGGYDGIKSALSVQAKNLQEVKKKYDELFANILKGSSVVGKKLEVFRNRKFFDFFGSPLKTRFVDIKEALFGKSYDELEELFSKGMLVGQEKEDFENLRELREELLATGKSIEDLQNDLNELLTGTSLNQLASGFVDLFRQGKTSAKDFSDYVQEVIRNAMVNSFIAKYATKMMEPFFNELSAQMDSGNYDYASLQKMGQDAAEQITAGLRVLEQSMGIKLFDDIKGSGIGSEISRLITEETAGKLEGLQRAMFEQMKITNAYLKAMVNASYDATGGFNLEVISSLNASINLLSEAMSDVAEYTSVLPNMDNNLDVIKNGIITIAENSKQISGRDLGV